jgi:hypothetical protein
MGRELVLETDPQPGLTPKAKQSVLELIRKMKDSGQPVTLTIHGEAELVVGDQMSYQMLLDLVDRLETIEGIQEGLASIDRGEGRPAKEFFEDMRRKYAIPQEG